LRNNEEHAALVHLARGRIYLHAGWVEQAIQSFRSALDGTQWFGKIGTNQDDLIVAATISLSQALKRRNNILQATLTTGIRNWLAVKREIFANRIESWWLDRRARQILLTDLRDIEDLTIRNTDSLLEYPTLGETLRGLSPVSLSRRLTKEGAADQRAPAKLFYQLYQVESELGWWNSATTLASLDSIMERARPRYDELLLTHATLLRMRTLNRTSQRYRDLAYRVFFTAPAELRNYGLPLPVILDLNSLSHSQRSKLRAGPFLEVSAENSDPTRVCSVSAVTTGIDTTTLRFTCPSQSAKNRTVEDSDPSQLVNKLSEALFRQEVTNANPSS
jgi:hypothetical protein